MYDELHLIIGAVVKYYSAKYDPTLPRIMLWTYSYSFSSFLPHFHRNFYVARYYYQSNFAKCVNVYLSTVFKQNSIDTGIMNQNNSEKEVRCNIIP